MPKNPYQILQVSQTAEKEVIEAAYKSLARKYHPDINKTSEAMERMKDINWAYEMLSDPIRRTEFDQNVANPYKPSGKTSNSATFQYSWREDKPSNLAENPENKSATGVSICQNCGRLGQTKKVKFRRHIGALVLRFERTIDGNLCRDCIADYFWKYSLITLFLGWWGIISLIVTPFILLSNVGNYIGSWGMDAPLETHEGPNTNWARNFFLVSFTLLIIVVIWGVIMMNSASESPTSNTYYSPTATKVVRPTVRAPTSTPNRSQTTVAATQTAVNRNNTSTNYLSDCIWWNQVAKTHVGKQICVYGMIYKIQTTEQYIQIIRFSDNAGTFLVRGENFLFDGVDSGICVKVIGTVQNANGSYLYMDTTYTKWDYYDGCN